MNPSNKYVTTEFIESLLKKHGIEKKIQNVTIWQQAFVLKSYLKETSDFKTSNERLEWLGDAYIQLAVSNYLYERFEQEDEGFLTKLRSKLVKKQTLSMLSKKLGLSEYIMMSIPTETKQNGRENINILEDTFEAFIGSMYIYFKTYESKTKALEYIELFLKNIIEQYIDIVSILENIDDHKTLLMQYYHKTFKKTLPIYEHIKTENKQYYIQIRHPMTHTVIASYHSNKKKYAEQQCAKQALMYFSHPN